MIRFKRYHPILVLTLLFALFILPGYTYASDSKIDLSPLMGDTSKLLDPRELVLGDYLAQKNSPLQKYAHDFIEAAKQYNVDWKLPPAIAGAESNLGKRIPANSNNAWGWGIYDDNIIRFKSWKDAIFTVTKGIRQGYLNKGLTTPQLMNPVWAQDPNWYNNVNFFLNDIDQFARNSKYADQIYPITTITDDNQRLFVNDAYLKVEDHQFQLVFVE